jgi:hypothetical protein
MTIPTNKIEEVRNFTTRVVEDLSRFWEKVPQLTIGDVENILASVTNSLREQCLKRLQNRDK